MSNQLQFEKSPYLLQHRDNPVHWIPWDKQAFSAARSQDNVIEFAKSNSIRICCEGVENTQELVTLAVLQPNLIQGYLFDKPNTAQIIERAYIDTCTKEYKDRLQFIQKILELKESLGVIRFNPKEVMRESGLGLWIMHFHQGKGYYELRLDETAEQLLALPVNCSPRDCYSFWYDNLHPEYVAHVQDSLQQMAHSNQNLQTEFLWCHPHLGTVQMRFCGKRVTGPDGVIILEGYCQNVADIAQKEK